MVNAIYRGRFAPSPTGPLHLGSLVAALVSYLDAKANNGKWLVRIDDVDSPRVVANSADSILHTLTAHGLHWDEPVRYQSQHASDYIAAKNALQHQTYPCICSRRDIGNSAYSGSCKNAIPANDKPAAIRISSPSSVIAYNDRWQGRYVEDIKAVHGDFVIWRKDKICAYQLAVVVDDNASGINHVVRGIDLQNSVARQLWLYKCLNLQAPSYAHHPIIVDNNHVKHSKQNQAPAINNAIPAENLTLALRLLRQPLPDNTVNVKAILNFATANWQPQKMPLTEIIATA